MSAAPSLPAPLAGIRVLDFGHIVAGPFCVRMLADLGADVVKVETNTREGQLGARRNRPQTATLHGRTALLSHINRSRRSIDLNLKSEEGRATALKLIGVADVLVENFSSGVMERLGMGYDVLKELNPRLVYCSMSGYGHTGPRRDWISMNVNLQAHCGLMLATGRPGDPPIGISNSWNDYVAGLHAALAIVGALAERGDTGAGRHLDVSQFEACVATLGALVWSSAVTRQPPERLGNRSKEIAPQGCYPCEGQDEWCALAVRTDDEWRALASALGAAGLRDEKYATLAGRLAHHDAIDAAIGAWTRQRTKEEVEERLKAAGVPAERVRKANELSGTAEWERLLHSIEDSPGVSVKTMGVPFRFGGSANTPATRSPRMGEHSDEVQREWLGGKASAPEKAQRARKARILDLTSEAGAYGTRLLAELGHEVIRIESPAGDPVRQLAPCLGESNDLEAGAFHRFWNAGKKSVALDLSKEEGRRRLVELVRRSDAVIASLPLPVDDKRLLEANPNLVLVRLDDGGPELCLYARSGLMAITGEPGESPLLMGGHIALSAVGTYLAIAASAALLVQQATGRGQAVDVSAQEALSALAEQALIEYQSAGEVLERRGGRGGITAVAGAIPCRDGHWMLSAPPSPQGWANFLQLTRIPALMQDESLSSEAARKEKKDYILDTVGHWSTDFDAQGLVERAQGLHVPATPVTSPLHLTHDAQLVARGFLRDEEQPPFGKIPVPVGALAALWGRALAPAPRLGEHNGELLV